MIFLAIAIVGLSNLIVKENISWNGVQQWQENLIVSFF
jgi:hypothetical protein